MKLPPASHLNPKIGEYCERYFNTHGCGGAAGTAKLQQREMQHYYAFFQNGTNKAKPNNCDSYELGFYGTVGAETEIVRLNTSSVCFVFKICLQFCTRVRMSSQAISVKS